MPRILQVTRLRSTDSGSVDGGRAVPLLGLVSDEVESFSDDGAEEVQHAEADGWSLLAFEYIDGAHADYTPKSPDLPGIMASMIQLSEVPAPALELKTMPHRLRTYVADTADLSWFAGNHLLHTEWNPHNVLMTADHARFVDWGWASIGAAWIDPALWLLWLIAHGHTCEQAENAASAHPAWDLARGPDALARTQHRPWDSIAAQSPDDWAKPMQAAAASWETCRTRWPDTKQSLPPPPRGAQRFLALLWSDLQRLLRPLRP
ncbi:hypothetical protein ACIRP3_43790 [Streptomyces sp. NPDC101209]|uniref:hypothetical protein n=1 Tax=Streptomyces sp. NPDC101209 TaxID=3366129 RepID=UPI003823C9E9